MALGTRCVAREHGPPLAAPPATAHNASLAGGGRSRSGRGLQDSGDFSCVDVASTLSTNAKVICAAPPAHGRVVFAQATAACVGEGLGERAGVRERTGMVRMALLVRPSSAAVVASNSRVTASSAADELVAKPRDGCYVNPFVGEGRYARYLRNWLDIVPKRQILLVNFDEWTDDAATTMRAVADFLNLAPFTFRVEEAHNTHKSRSVHVEKEGKSNAAELKAGTELSLTAGSELSLIHI